MLLTKKIANDLSYKVSCVSSFNTIPEQQKATFSTVNGHLTNQFI